MHTGRWLLLGGGVVVLLALVGIGAVGVLSDAQLDPEQTVELRSNGDVVTTVDVAVAETRAEREDGLSVYQPLDPGEGMLFIHDTERTQEYWMNGMSFGIDIVFIGDNCTITTIHHAEQPAAGETGREDKHRYSGVGKYVLEVPYNYTVDRVQPGDTVTFAGGCPA